MYFLDDSGRLADRDVDTLAIAGSESYTYDVFDRLTGISAAYTSDGSVHDAMRGVHTLTNSEQIWIFDNGWGG